MAAVGLFLVAGQPGLSFGAEFPAVKKSRNGICHERGTVHYVQTERFRAYDSLQACLESGGRRPFAVDTDMPTRVRGYAIEWTWLIIGIVTLLVVATPFAWRWWNRRRLRRGYRKFEQRAWDRWSGHRFDPKVSGRMIDRSGADPKGEKT